MSRVSPDPARANELVAISKAYFELSSNFDDHDSFTPLVSSPPTPPLPVPNTSTEAGSARQRCLHERVCAVRAPLEPRRAVPPGRQRYVKI